MFCNQVIGNKKQVIGIISFAIGGHISHFSPLTTKAYLLLLTSCFLLL